jgi:hypothetical protein
MATQEATAAPAPKRSEAQARHEMRGRPAEKLTVRVTWALVAALCLGFWTLVVVGFSLVL